MFCYKSSEKILIEVTDKRYKYQGNKMGHLGKIIIKFLGLPT